MDDTKVRNEKEPKMLINIYLVDDDDSESLEASGVSLESCFPDDPDVVPAVLAYLAKVGVAYYGGGALPLFKFVPASTEKR